MENPSKTELAKRYGSSSWEAHFKLLQYGAEDQPGNERRVLHPMERDAMRVVRGIRPMTIIYILKD